MTTSDRSTWCFPSSLFTLRLWQEAIGGEPKEVRIQVRHVLSGETRYFRDWAQMAAYLEQKLHESKKI